VARAAASEEYERAIDEGNTAVLLEHDGNGLYTVSLGNLLAGETAVIRYRYAELLDAHHGRVRLAVPTVIAPRYGDPRDAGLEGPAVPGVDLLGEYPFDIRLELTGLKDASTIRSPSYRIATSVTDTGLTVTLARTGFLDRDFVLEIDQAAVTPQALLARDGDAYVCLASPVLATDTTEARPLALKVLLDCSGSMGGDSIAAAKRALLAMIDRLTPQDRLNLTRFGSSVEQMTEGLEPADEHSLAPLNSVIRQIDADLGGTEMRAALEAVLQIEPRTDAHADIILITDGEVYDVEGVVSLAARSKHRLFAIAIGAAPNEALARSLAVETGGGCEFVGPSDDAEAAIIRTFKRLRATPRTLGAAQWPTQPDWTAPLPTAVFPGDTLHFFAGFSTQPTGELALTIAEPRGTATTLRIPLASQLTDGDLLPRLAAASRLPALDEAAARDLAVRYQLATAHTSFVVVAARADGEKATDLPATVAVPHMLAAGWGGAAIVQSAAGRALSTMNASVELCGAQDGQSLSRAPRALFSRRVSSDTVDLSFLWKDRPPFVTFTTTDRRLLLEALHEAFLRRNPMPRDLNELAHAFPVPPGVLEMLRQGTRECHADESQVVAAFLAWLEGHAETTDMDPDFLALLGGQVAGRRGFRALRKFMTERLGK
jgi:Ca-activated chloride channel family protein